MMGTNMLADLFKTGQGLNTPAITDAAQIKVQPIATGVDPVTLHKQAGKKVAEGFKADVAKDNKISGLLGALTSGAANALGGGGESQQQASMAQRVRGGSYFDNPGANAISNMQLAGKLGGILNGRSA